MRIGELASLAGVNVQSVRFYERRRILRKPARTVSGYRVYSKSDVDDICFVKQCQQLGFTLKEIQPLLNLHRAAARMMASGVGRPAELREIEQLARVKLAQIDEKMRALRSMRLRLLAMVDRIETVSAVGCPGVVGSTAVHKRSAASRHREDSRLS
jgi:MerR family transcriptional regulator, mercuric resistance operon regulatory protein